MLRVVFSPRVCAVATKAADNTNKSTKKVQTRNYSGDLAFRDHFRLTYPQSYKDKHQKLVIVGGGTAGLSLLNRLSEQYEWVNATIIEPSMEHFYQPAWTLVGCGEMHRDMTRKYTRAYIPDKVNWVKDRVVEFDPDNNRVQVGDGDWITYDILAVTMGIELQWNKVKGLTESIGRTNVTSNYSYETCGYTWDLIQQFDGGNALFTQPDTPIKCGGAPQKIMYLAEDHWLNKAEDDTLRERTNIEFLTGTPSNFGVPEYAKVLRKECESRDLNITTHHNLVEIKGEEAIFRDLKENKEVVKRFDFLHVTPPQGAPSVLANSVLSDDAGWLDVDKSTLQHVKYPNVFGLGDCTNTPNAKSASAITEQHAVVGNNIMCYATGADKSDWDVYEGFTGCPIPLGSSQLLMATFGYGGKLYPDSKLQPTWFDYLTKKLLFPPIYWNYLLKGTWEGPNRFRTSQLRSWRKHWQETVIKPKVEWEQKDEKHIEGLIESQTYTGH